MSIEETIAAAVLAQLAPRLEAIERRIATAPSKLLTRKEIAEWASCSARTVDNWIAEGCPVHRIGGPGGSPRFDVDEVKAWLKARA